MSTTVNYKGNAITTVTNETKTLTTSGKWMEADILITDVTIVPQTQIKSATPSETEQTISPDSGYYLSSVTVGAISSTYVGSGIARKSSTDLTASGATVTAPAGYYDSAASKTISSGVLSNPSISVSNSGLITATSGVGTAGYLATTATASNTSQLTALGATTYNTSSSNQTITSGKYITGTQTILAVATSNISAGNIKYNVTVKVGDANDDDRITSVTGTFSAANTVSSGQTAAAAAQILSGYSAFVNGAEVQGSIATKTSSDLTASGATVTVPAGYYASQATKSVSTMTLPTSAASSATSGYTSKATISRSTSAQYINIPPGYNSAGGYYTISAVSNMTLPTSASSTSSGTSKATISRSSSAQYINIPVGYNETASYYTISAVADMTLPTAASSTSSGTSKATISRSTSAQYINIPTGYNATASYYTISATPNMTLPTSASSTSSGTSKATISRSTSNQYINIPTGYNETASYYTISATPNGTAGTPTATKGTVSNHSVSVTPSVTNTTGYITGSTLTGTAVTVSASELVSGSQTVTSNQTVDVTNLASLVVDVPTGTGGDYTRTTIVPSQTATTVVENSAYLTMANGSSTGFVDGAFYIITYDNVEYISSCEVLWGDNYCLGEVNQIFGSTDGVVFPFAVVFYQGDYYFYHQISGSHTYKIELLEFVNPVSYQTIYQGSANPTSGTGVNGDIYIKS